MVLLNGTQSKNLSTSSTIFKNRDNQPPSSFNDKSMIRGAVSSNDLAWWWCQWLLQVQFTFVYEKILEVDVI